MRVSNRPRGPYANKRDSVQGARARFRWKLRYLSVTGLQRVYDRAKELDRREVMNWCVMEAHRRVEQQELASMPELVYRATTAEGAHA